MHLLNSRTLKLTSVLLCLLLAPGSLSAETIRIESKNTVSETIGRLTGAIKKSGAQIFSVFDFQKGVASIGQTIRPTSGIIFGNPKIGGAIFQKSQTFGLYLPLRILAYKDEQGKVWMIYDDPADAATKHNVPNDHPAIRAMQRVLVKLTGLAAVK